MLLGVLLAIPGSAQPAAARGGDGSIVVNAGQSRVVQFPYDIARVAVADPSVSDFRVISGHEVYLLGKGLGRTSVQLWSRDGRSFHYFVDVVIDPEPLRGELLGAMPGEADLQISAAAASLIIGGSASDAVAADAIRRIAHGYAESLARQLQRSAGGQSAGGQSAGGQGGASQGGGLQIDVIDRLRVRDTRQVKLEVRIAEVSKTLVDRLGLNVVAGNASGNFRWSLGSSFLGAGSGTGGLSLTSGGTAIKVDLDAEARRGQLRILAEPTIIAISGQEAQFLVGGKVFIPIPQSGGTAGTSAITLEERDYGVGLRFTPTVLDGERITLKVAPEVSELSREPLSFGSGANMAVLPSFTTSKVSTTVQLTNGQSLTIGGLLRNTSAETLKSFPLLGDIPLLGQLFRSKDFARDKSELVVIIRATLVEPDAASPALPPAFDSAEGSSKNSSAAGSLAAPAPAPAPAEQP
jgi:pilus assembly protein CpaC